MKIYFASDHAGFELKNALRTYVQNELSHETIDCGAFAYDETDDYPGFVRKAAESVARDSAARAIILGKSGQGEAMAANRFPNVRAAVYYGGSEEIVTLSRVHNDANVLSLGAGFLDEETAKRVVSLWLQTEFSGEARHKRRIRDIDRL